MLECTYLVWCYELKLTRIGPRDLLCMILIRSSSWSPHGPNPCRNDFEEGTHKTSMWSPEICVHLDECKEWAFNRDLANPPADVDVASNSAFLKKNKNVFLKHLFNQIGTWLKDHQSSFYSVWTMGGLRSQGGFRIHGQDGDGTEIYVLGPVEVCWATPWKSPKSTCTLGRADALPIAVVHRPLAVSF